MYFYSDIHVVMKKSYQGVKPKPKTTANKISNKYGFNPIYMLHVFHDEFPPEVKLLVKSVPLRPI